AEDVVVELAGQHETRTHPGRRFTVEVEAEYDRRHRQMLVLQPAHEVPTAAGVEQQFVQGDDQSAARERYAVAREQYLNLEAEDRAALLRVVAAVHVSGNEKHLAAIAGVGGRVVPAGRLLGRALFGFHVTFSEDFNGDLFGENVRRAQV